jgi:epoxyqueuosine reductase
LTLTPSPEEITRQIKSWGIELGFQQLGITDVELGKAENRLKEWLDAKYHGEMEYMARHGDRRSRPGALVPNTIRVISARMDFLPDEKEPPAAILEKGDRAYIARYALGRDYHKVLRKRLQKLADRIESAVGPIGYRVFVDSAPVMEKPLAEKAGLGWIGKHTNIINKQSGSWFLLGEIFTDLPLSLDSPATDHCGSCQACIDICPTAAIVAPYVVDARRCISYLTIELKGTIPVEFRTAIGNRIFGCDDCQLVCPWNKFARVSDEPDFAPRHHLDSADLVTLFGWTEKQWQKYTAGSAIRRPGYQGWLRNIAIALGNAPPSESVLRALESRASHESIIVREHVEWALQQQREKKTGSNRNF